MPDIVDLGSNDIHFTRNDYVYIITSIDGIENDRRRCAVRSFCTSLQNAEDLIKGNYGDLREPGVQFVCVEKVLMNGVDMISEHNETVWYKWISTGKEYDRGYFELSEQPEDLKTTINFFS